MKNKNRGFTLIELLVVIAIIGLLSGVVMASLNIARGKSADVAAKADLNGIRSQGEVVNDTVGNYDTVCTNANVVMAVADAAFKEGLTWASEADNSDDIACVDSDTAWVVYTQLPKGAGIDSWWCVDSVGSAKLLGASPTPAVTACP